MKKVSVFCICIFMMVMFSSCSKFDALDGKSDVLDGKYVSESGKYTIDFNADGTCTWYEEFLGIECFFKGTYEKEDNVYKLYIEGGEFSFNTVFTAEPVDDGLIITGGVVDSELFSKNQ